MTYRSAVDCSTTELLIPHWPGACYSAIVACRTGCVRSETPALAAAAAAGSWPADESPPGLAEGIKVTLISLLVRPTDRPLHLLSAASVATSAGRALSKTDIATFGREQSLAGASAFGLVLFLADLLLLALSSPSI